MEDGFAQYFEGSNTAMSLGRHASRQETDYERMCYTA